MIVATHLWVTVDGGLVESGDPAAVTLKYPAGTVLTDAEAVAAGLKQSPQPPNKQAKAPRNKGA